MDFRAEKTNIFLLQVAAVSVLWGYAYLCLLEKTPFSVFFWNESLLGPWLFIPWEVWLSEYADDRFLKNFSRITGFWLLIAGFALLLVRQFPRITYFFAFSGAVILCGIAVLNGMDKIFFTVQFSEYILQWGSPLFFVFGWRNKVWPLWFVRFMKAAAAITFTAHGLYAMGIFPRPAHFIEMTMSILNVEEGGAIQFLNLAGWLDLIVAILIWIPKRGLQRTALAYMVFWGTLTTLARWVAHIHPELPWRGESLMAWTPEVLVRLPHFLIPFVLWRITMNVIPKSL